MTDGKLRTADELLTEVVRIVIARLGDGCLAHELDGLRSRIVPSEGKLSTAADMLDAVLSTMQNFRIACGLACNEVLDERLTELDGKLKQLAEYVSNPPPSSDYVRGLRDAMKLVAELACRWGSTAHPAFISEEIKRLIDAAEAEAKA